jgi:orotidine-5'-phosphate decarboxylase
MSSPRDYLAIALDVDETSEAVRVASMLRPYFAFAKVGLQLFLGNGPDCVRALADLGFQVFLDLKVHDIPNTCRAAGRRIGTLPVDLTTVHLAAGTEGVSAFREGLRETALRPPLVAGVTVLTSSAQAQADVEALIRVAKEARVEAVVMSGPDLARTRHALGDLLAVVPGVRPPGAIAHDQVRISQPAEALSAGASLLVVGRAVTAAEDPVAAAEEISASMRATLERPAPALAPSMAAALAALRDG